MLNQKVRLSTTVLVTIAMFDLVSSMILLSRGHAEGNPIFGQLVPYGSWVFVSVKVFFVAGPILLIEFVRAKAPRTAEIGTWTAAALYAAIYVGHLLRIRP